MIIVRPKLKGFSAAAIDGFAARAQRMVRLRGEVAILITTSAQLRRLNREFRGKDKPTDVLSFPSVARGVAGDIAISAQIARAQAKEHDHSLATELKVLILHGLLHLAGHDHENDGGEMAELERRLRGRLELSHGLIERVAKKRTAKKRKAKKSSASQRTMKSATQRAAR